MTEPDRATGRTPVWRAAAGGVAAAMAMSGLRQLTHALGLVERTPPESVLQTTAPELFYRVPKRRRPALVELAHWTYGAGAAAVFGALPGRLRQRAWAGPAYGLLVWTGFEAVISPVLGLAPRPRHGVVEATALLVDHLLYGVLVGASLRGFPTGEEMRDGVTGAKRDKVTGAKRDKAEPAAAVSAQGRTPSSSVARRGVAQ